MSICVSGTTPASVPTETFVRVMRWTFRRDQESIVCELGLSRDDAAYELRIDGPTSPSGRSTERFDDAMSAFQRHAAIERTLVNEGWSLEGFQSERVPR